MTTRYEELATLALADSRAMFQEQLGCKACAAAARQALVKYLQAPPEDVQFVTLDKGLKATTTKSALPELTAAPDLSWHFAIQVHFGSEKYVNYAAVVLYMSVWGSGDKFTLKHDREFSVDPKSEASFDELAAHVYASLRDDYARPRQSRRKQIGFLADV